MDQAAVRSSIACDTFSHHTCLSLTRGKRGAVHHRSKGVPPEALPERMGSGVCHLVAVSLKGVGAIFCLMRQKIAQPCAYVHGCILRRRRVSTLVGLFCPWPGHTTGTSGP